MKIDIPVPGEIISNLSLIEWKWFVSRGSNTGIVLAKDLDRNLYHGYIGHCNILGSTERKDIQNIIDWGCNLSGEETMGFFPHKKNMPGILEEENWKT